MLYIFDEIDLPDEEFFNSKLHLLSEQRSAKVKRLFSNLNKRASISVYLMLRLALLEIHGIDKAVLLEYEENGKPYLKNHPGIFFSLSHSQNIAACIVADKKVGLDIQKTRPVKDNLAKRILTEDEYVIFKNSLSPDDYFCEVWTIKESFLKKTGDGISKELRDIAACSITAKTFKGKDYFCTVCGISTADIKVKYLRSEDFGKLL